ncbi:hypothetical protein [Catenuloplanes atrovinosus]|uniref:Uncharacterized protein n=1 Tax=Catenuloplanes atrovinosus TaxID=137266 RepID=A0AAE4CBY9_9ACTN|nr:hypothetical protein [Catenuloplanes atrovinosus]MDR7279116.1 hypothetical protein [Catenuloplanes atrovinosus]
MNQPPYRRWRHVVYAAGVTATGLLTVSILLTLAVCVLAWFGGVGTSGTPSSGY